MGMIVHDHDDAGDPIPENPYGHVCGGSTISTAFLERQVSNLEKEVLKLAKEISTLTRSLEKLSRSLDRREIR